MSNVPAKGFLLSRALYYLSRWEKGREKTVSYFERSGLLHSLSFSRYVRDVTEMFPHTVEVEGILFDSTAYVPRKRGELLMTKEPDMIAWMDEHIHPGDCLYDIGANVGVFSLYAALKRGAQVISFEPEASNFHFLNRNILHNNASDKIKALCIGLSDSEGISPLVLSNASLGDSGHALGSHDGDEEILDSTSPKEWCLSFSLNEIVKFGNLPIPTHIKIDTDTFEERIISGMSEILANPVLKSLVVEVPNDENRAKQIIETLNMNNFIETTSGVPTGSHQNKFFFRHS